MIHVRNCDTLPIKDEIHAVIHNFSRRILSWRLAERLDPNTTCEILKEASENLGLTPTVVADSGVENVNAGVDQLMADGLVRRVIAQVEVSFSNSIVEAFWCSLRHQWLYLHSLDSFTQLEQLIDFYVQEHNTQMPITHLSDKRRTRCTLAKPMVCGTASRPPGLRLVGQESRQTKVSHAACADHRSLNP